MRATDRTRYLILYLLQRIITYGMLLHDIPAGNPNLLECAIIIPIVSIHSVSLFIPTSDISML